MKNAAESFVLVDDWGNEMRFEKVSTDLLRVDDKLQRPISPKHLESMSGDAFQPKAMRPLTVSKRKNGFYYILDGQNRWTAGRDKANFFVCQVYEGLTRKDEANLFVLLNNASKVNPNDKFKVRLNAGESHEREINGIVKSYNLKLNLTGRKPKASEANETISALAVVQKIVNLYGKEGLSNTLYVISEVFKIGDGKVMSAALKDMFILGVAQAVSESKWDRSDIVEALRIDDPERRRDFVNEVSEYAIGMSTRRSDVALNVKKWLLGRLNAA